jgi:hypothetical protein
VQRRRRADPGVLTLGEGGRFHDVGWRISPQRLLPPVIARSAPLEDERRSRNATRSIAAPNAVERPIVIYAVRRGHRYIAHLMETPVRDRRRIPRPCVDGGPVPDHEVRQ